MDLTHNPYNRAVPKIGKGGAVCTSQPLAAAAGLEILRLGGNAVDAAIATAVALTVLEPTSNGIGGDAFALVWDGAKLHGLNGSGRAPAALNTSLVNNMLLEGQTHIPKLGWLPVTVPGAPAAWRDLHAKFGNLPFSQLFEAAISYAKEGFPVSPITARGWERAAKVYTAQNGPEFAAWASTFTLNHRAPRAGEIMRLPDHAKTLEGIAESNAARFYEGELAQAIADFAQKTGGFISQGDLAAHSSSWVEPISTSYKGFEVWEIPPNGQGVAALTALNILEGFDLNHHPRDSVQGLHLQLEAMKLGFADTLAHVADPLHMRVSTAGLLDKAYAAQRRALISETALEPAAGSPPRGGTVYLCTADQDGMMVSFIQSNYAGFGSGIVVPGTGIALQNRGANFSLDVTHPNCLEPSKRPFHTIIPGFLTKKGAAVGPFGVMGGFMQPQGHLQVVVNTVDYHLNPQAALDAPRWQWLEGKKIELEPEFPPEIARGLAARGHQVSVQRYAGSFGRGQMIWRDGDALIAATESRADGSALVF